MSANIISIVSPRSALLMLRLRVGEGVQSLRRAWRLASRDAVSRRNLRVMDDRMLSDIGISRAQAKFEAHRWH